MRYCLTNAQMRMCDESTIKGGVSSETLMTRAGEAIADEVVKLIGKNNERSVTIVCGTGNNGGDGYVCARVLSGRGIRVKVFAIDGRLSSDCAREKGRYKGEYTDEVCANIIVDCIFGTGLSRDINGKFAEVIEKINSQKKSLVVSADIPSGINGDDGRVCAAAVKADITVAIAHEKLGCVFGDGKDYCGKAIVKDIGIEPCLGAAVIFEREDIAKLFPKRKLNSNKGTYGSACVIAGCGKYFGAPVLSVSSALRSGCGYVRAVVPQELKAPLAVSYPQAIYGEEPYEKADCIAVGMGCGNTEETYKTVVSLLNTYKGKLIIDADGINALARYGADILKGAACDVLITPHIKEFSRLSGLSAEEIKAAPVKAAQNFAREYGVIVHLKDASSVTCDGVNAYISDNGCSALAKGGSGDILAGLACGYAARGLSLVQAIVCARYVLGLSSELCAEEYGEECTTSKELVASLHKAVKEIKGSV